MKFRKLLRDQSGFLLPGVLSFIIAMTIFGTSILMVILNNFYVVGNNVTSQKAFNIAEGGLNYYLWHLSHFAGDYKDGQTTPTAPDPTLGYGPYVHDYTDANGKKLGTYTLWLRPEGSGSTIINVRAIGQATGSSITRTLEAKVGKASFASYGLVANIALWFGETESATGPVHSNAGVRMDGPNSDIVVSPNLTYTPPNGLGDNGSTSHPGVWCSTAVVTNPTCGARDKSNWLIGTKPDVDFGQLTASLCEMKTIAFSDNPATAALATQANRCSQVPTTRTSAYIPKRTAPPAFSATRGYLIQLNPNSTYDLYNVNAETDTATTYLTALNPQNLTPAATNIPLPSKGVIYVEDNVWVRSNDTFKGRVSIAAGRLDTTDNAEITIADDLKYSTKDGSDSIGLVSEGDVIIAPYAPPTNGAFTFEVDGALLASNGSVRYPASYAGTSTCTRGWTATNQNMIFYGSVGSKNTWTWNTVGGSCGNRAKDPASSNWFSGIMRTDTQYDFHMLYAPPPSYPLVGGYQILSWREVLTRP